MSEEVQPNAPTREKVPVIDDPIFSQLAAELHKQYATLDGKLRIATLPDGSVPVQSLIEMIAECKSQVIRARHQSAVMTEIVIAILGEFPDLPFQQIKDRACRNLQARIERNAPAVAQENERASKLVLPKGVNGKGAGKIIGG